MNKQKCDELAVKWKTGKCYNTAPYACPIPSAPVWWVPKTCTKNHNGCVAYYNCNQLTCSAGCNKLISVGCVWRNNECVYSP
jgi:hypothetical protein